MTAILFPKNQINLLTSGKKQGTLRDINFKVNPNIPLKFLCNFKYGVFIEVKKFKIEPFNINMLDKKTSLLLGYDSPKDYLDNNNWGVKSDDRIIITWDFKDVTINWNSVNKNMGVKYEI